MERYASDEYLMATAVDSLNGGCTSEACKKLYASSEAGAKYALATLYPEMLPNNYERYSDFRVDKANGMATFKWVRLPCGRLRQRLAYGLYSSCSTRPCSCVTTMCK